MKFGQWLAAERKRKAFTQDSFAVAAGYSQAMISKIENGGDITRRAERGGGVATSGEQKDASRCQSTATVSIMRYLRRANRQRFYRWRFALVACL